MWYACEGFVVSIAPDSRSRRVLSGINGCKRAAPPPAAETSIGQGDALLQQGNTAEAVREYSSAIEHNSRSTDARIKRAGAYLRLKQYDPALLDVDEAIKLDPSNPEYYLTRATVDVAASHLDQALSDIASAVARKPDHAGAYSMRAGIQIERGEFDEAIASAEQAIRFQPHHAGAFNNRGLAHLRKGEMQAAIADFSQALEFVPQHADALTNRGVAYQSLGQLDKALADWTQVLRADPRAVDARYNRACYYIKSGQMDPGISDLTALITPRARPDRFLRPGRRSRPSIPEAFGSPACSGRPGRRWPTAMQRLPSLPMIPPLEVSSVNFCSASPWQLKASNVSILSCSSWLPRVFLAVASAVLLSTQGCRRNVSTVSADGSAPPAAPLFQDVSLEKGLPPPTSNWPDPTFAMRELGCGGVALLDYDGDGRLDIYQVRHPPPGHFRDSLPNRLFHQEADGHFTEVPAAGGASLPGYGTGVAVGDYNNDGHPDLFVTNYGQNRLYRNNGNGTFTDVTQEAGLLNSKPGEELWSTSATWLDYDRDGFLDLYVAHFAISDAVAPCTDKDGKPEYCADQDAGDDRHALSQ